MSKSVIVVGTGNAALCAALAALESGAGVTLLEKADKSLSGGNTKYTAGAMRFAYDGADDLLPLLRNPEDPRVKRADFGSYTTEKFANDLLGFNDGRPLSEEQEALVHQSGATLRWLASHGVKFEPIYSRQSFEKDGRHVFWGGLTLAAENEGVGLFDMELAAVERLGGTVRYNSAVTGLVTDAGRVCGVQIGQERLLADAVILACGGFEANGALRVKHMGENWEAAKAPRDPRKSLGALGLRPAAKTTGEHLCAHCTRTFCANISCARLRINRSLRSWTFYPLQSHPCR
ncbi:hypothetical protein IMCC1933_28330 [Rhodobacteraceae bacterium IMCC1933]|nr:hypothetical protein [Rhodobacteraceae bacterium IMCC1923]MDP4069265.1 hypothetical protein [Rhodobacteraceae bacterium IMCC1933]MDP4070249.1 hypothetical protein [Rhodobacteraceae bacterium IMCC1909]